MTAFWDIAPCSAVDGDWHFSGACCSHYEGDDKVPRESDPLLFCQLVFTSRYFTVLYFTLPYSGNGSF
jgi:hypothetical protein